MMKWISTIYLGLTLAVSFAQTPPAETNFEQPGRVETKLFVPPDVMKGPSHSVSSEAENDGLNNTYILYSGGDAWSVGDCA